MAAPAVPARFHLIRLDAVGSTNAEAERRARTGACSGTLIIAAEQTAGRGRAGRTWLSPPGNLYSSVVYRPGCAAAAATNLSFVVALAVAEAASGLSGAAPGGGPAPAVTCKWPNDVLVDGRKVAGILLESALGGDDRVDWVIMGAGINVASAPAMPVAPYPSAALSAFAPAIDVETVLAAYAGALDRWLAVWERDGFPPVRAAWLARAHGRGRRVVARVGAEAIEGVFVDLEPDGTLLLATGGGGMRRIAAGDVFPAAG